MVRVRHGTLFTLGALQTGSAAIRPGTTARSIG
jgi:hypothetical protein